MDIFAVFFYLFNLTFLFIAIEYAYSFYKKDGIYSTRGTLGNLLNGLVLRLVSRTFVTFYIGYALVFYVYITDATLNFEPIPFFICLVLVDLFYYIFHRLHHAISLLWVLHRVHHGDNKFNLSTAFRISWIEQVYLTLFFIPVLLVGFHPFMILIAYNFLSIYQFACHSQYIKFPKLMNYLFVTPQSHKIHHDQEIHHQNSNFGAIFSIWDRLFGTHTESIETFTPGIKGYRQDNFIGMEIDPIVEYVKNRPS